jgi:hypothetical protein
VPADQIKTSHKSSFIKKEFLPFAIFARVFIIVAAAENGCASGRTFFTQKVSLIKEGG